MSKLLALLTWLAKACTIHQHMASHHKEKTPHAYSLDEKVTYLGRTSNSGFSIRIGLVHGLSWTGLAAPTTPWLRAKVSNLMAICDARWWIMAGQTVKSWDRNLYAFCYV
ncbi:hypothetical protein TIFTF001_020512 [Ficus carica]|uniref:Secreted protein n=1 Tax=Ficus carica TaxID=3494 RepID=A0AA88D9V9_FICCA|nr:hypothetical protein TIFTF001_020512 [Ficus carica]